MERNLFKNLLTKFTDEKDLDKKVELLLSYELSSLTKPQIQKIIDTLEESEIKKFMNAISKKTGE